MSQSLLNEVFFPIIDVKELYGETASQSLLNEVFFPIAPPEIIPIFQYVTKRVVDIFCHCYSK
ncbi:hypothetical protein A45J_2065 [hot springs metagenome]|uniref:Uncharacterized protein n=1 Tax=hot springs metagenome TaxID=433727 RepID=A0A5J4KYE4_9ZZZZ